MPSPKHALPLANVTAMTMTTSNTGDNNATHDYTRLILQIESPWAILPLFVNGRCFDFAPTPFLCNLNCNSYNNYYYYYYYYCCCYCCYYYYYCCCCCCYYYY